MNNAEIIVIGDELLIGQVVDTNSGMIAHYLNEIGISVSRTTAVHDDNHQIKQAIQEAFTRVDLVLTTGGLGPTKDDITKNTLCELFNTHLVKSDKVEKHVKQLYQHRPDVLNRLTETQWLVPKDCVIYENRIGSAPLMWFEKEITKGGKPTKQILLSMPGVPQEAEIAMKEQFTEQLKKLSNKQILHKTIIVYGIPESSLAIKIEDWENSLPDYMHLAYLPKNRMIRLRLSGSTSNPHIDLNKEMSQKINQLMPLIKDYYIASDDIPIEVLLGEKLKANMQTISSAESCTGGRVAAMLNQHAGSSAFYKGSVVAYSNSIKEHVLGVNQQILNSVGAVSEQCVIDMAKGVKKLMQTDFSIATSGIAGPDGGTKDKPVGTVWMAFSTPKETVAKCFYFTGNRSQITSQAAFTALIELYRLM